MKKEKITGFIEADTEKGYGKIVEWCSNKWKKPFKNLRTRDKIIAVILLVIVILLVSAIFILPILLNLE